MVKQKADFFIINYNHMNIVNKIIDSLVIYLIKNYLLVITDYNLGEVWWRGLYHHVKQNLWEQKWNWLK